MNIELLNELTPQNNIIFVRTQRIPRAYLVLSIPAPSGWERRETEDRERQMSKEYAKQLVSFRHFNIVLVTNHPQLELVVELFRSAFH